MEIGIYRKEWKSAISGKNKIANRLYFLSSHNFLKSQMVVYNGL